MEKNLKLLLEEFLNEFELVNIEKYFGCDFCDDYDDFIKSGISEKVLDYLNEEFINIDLNTYDHVFANKKEHEQAVKDVINNALRML